jgi:hypothetical protein
MQSPQPQPVPDRRVATAIVEAIAPVKKFLSMRIDLDIDTYETRRTAGNCLETNYRLLCTARAPVHGTLLYI